MRFQDYFEYKGKMYYTGTVMIVNNYKPEQVATFVCYDTQREMYIYKIDRCKCHMHAERFYNSIIRITDKTNNDVHLPEMKTRKDGNIDGLVYRWIWYIFFMIVSTLFYDRIALWIIWSVVFFACRTNIIKKEGTYIEW